MTPPFEVAPLLASSDRIAHGFFGRQGGVSEGLYASLNTGPGSNDDPLAVVENRRRVADALGAQPDCLASLYQVHSADALSIDAPFGADRPKADALVTATPGLALCILTADCAPILLAAVEAGVIGAAHAGWKGALAGICDSVVDAMTTLGAAPGRMAAVIGPCIAQASYEVGPDFVERFVDESLDSEQYLKPGEGDRSHFDLAGFVRSRLICKGVSRVDTLPFDTCALESDYFSNRRRNKRGEADYGRNASVIMLRP